MSYPAPNTGDPELDRQWRRADYEMLLPRLLSAPTSHGFACWLDKLVLIDKEAITTYVRDHWGELDRERRMWAKLRLNAFRDLPID